MRKKFAFTLAEVLITLGIIGIIAAMTVPNLVNKYQKNMTVSKVQKAYANINVMAKNIQLNSGCDDVECLGWPTGKGGGITDEDKWVADEFVRLAGLKNAKVYKDTNYFRLAPIYGPKDYKTENKMGFKNIIVTPDGYAYTVIFFGNYYSPEGGTKPNEEMEKNIIVGVGTEFKVGPKGLADNKTLYQYTAGRNFFYFVIYEDFKVSPGVITNYGKVYGLDQLLRHPDWIAGKMQETPYKEAEYRCLPKYKNPTNVGLPQGSGCAALMLLDGWKMNY